MDRQRRHFRHIAKYSLFALLLSYIIVCQSCMRMRMTPKETAAFFNQKILPFQSQTLDCLGHRLHFVRTGDATKPTIYFVHGSPGSWDAYRQYLADSLLLKRYRMIAVDRPGFGYSDFGDAQDLETQAAVLQQLVAQTANGQPIVLVGHSLGGPVVVEMAPRQPGRYAHLVILAGAIDPDAETPEYWRRLLMYKPVRYLVPGALRSSNDELWWLKDDLKAMKPQLRSITSAVTIIHGTKDPLVPFSNVAFMQKEFVHARRLTVIPIENANHFIPWEHYGQIRDCLLGL